MGRIEKHFPCGCVIEMMTLGYWAGGDSLHKPEGSSCDQDDMHIAEAYAEANKWTLPELTIDFGWGNGTTPKEYFLQVYHLIKLCRRIELPLKSLLALDHYSFYQLVDKMPLDHHCDWSKEQFDESLASTIGLSSEH